MQNLGEQKKSIMVFSRVAYKQLMKINSNQCWFLRGRENRVTQGKTSRCRVEDLQTQPTHAADSGIEPAQGHSDGRRVFSLPRHPRT